MTMATSLGMNVVRAGGGLDNHVMVVQMVAARWKKVLFCLKLKQAQACV